jgi:transcription antitermination protein NusB
VAARLPSRKQARRDAAFVLYQIDVTGMPVETVLDNLERGEGYPPDDFTLGCIEGVLARRDAIDAQIDAHSDRWPLARLAPLERSILRLAFWELSSGETPPEVVIDEAVRLARRYSTDEAGALVNGILGGAVAGKGPASTPGPGGTRMSEDET